MIWIQVGNVKTCLTNYLDLSVVTPSGTLITPEHLFLIKKKSRSRRNFSALIYVEIFDEATRITSNVKGKKP